jgi:DnaK suppressor protein
MIVKYLLKKGHIMGLRNDIDLKAFETILKTEKTKIEKNIALLKAELSSIVDEDEIDDIEGIAGLEIDNTNDRALLQKLESEMSEINTALNKIALGTYGICERTGKPIPVARLNAIPTARTIVGE